MSTKERGGSWVKDSHTCSANAFMDLGTNHGRALFLDAGRQRKHAARPLHPAIES